MTPPLTTTLDELRSEIEKWAVAPFSESSANHKDEGMIEYGYGVAQAEIRSILREVAQPAPPAEALRLLRALLASHDALEDGLASFDLHNDAVTNLESVTIEARRYLAATEEGTP